MQMRFDFTLEHNKELILTEKETEEYRNEAMQFLRRAIGSEQWFIWVAELEGRVVSHIFLEAVHKVPRPGRTTNPFLYMTNVYTLPAYRGQGVGSALLGHIEAWAKERKFEFVIVWPSEESVGFYGKSGYARCSEPMELMLS
ncbi:GNAT family N-acetyltransferase [Paenibacillus arenilitoris]|nr:GNAT family N-acetyltransferase [Paenibacillus arenilitoris]